MINRKLKATLSLVLALIVMCSACVLPVFALDDVSGGGSSSNVIRVKRFSQMIDYAKNNNIDIENSHYIMTYSEDSSQYYWWYYIFFIPDDILVNDTLILTHDRYSSSFTNSFIKARVSDYGNSDIDDLEYCANVDVSSFSLYVDDDEQSHSNLNHIYATNVNITNNGDKLDVSSPFAKPYKASITYDDDSKNFLFNFEPKNDNDVYNVNIAVSNQSEWDYPNSDGWYYLPMDTSGDFTKENPLHGSIPLNVMRDGIMRYNSNKDIENTGKLYFFLIAAKGKGDEALYKDRFCAASYEYSLVDTVDSHKKEPFSEKKDYEEFPSLSDYIDTDFPDIRDYVNFDMFHDLDGIADFVKAVVEFLWNAFTGFFRWLWAALKFVFFNFLGIFEWLGKCLWTIVKNIGIALYNLVVDLKKLVTYLFVPNSKDLNVAIESKFPAYAKLRKAFQQGKQSSSNSVTFTLFGKDFDFNMNSAPNELKSALFNASTIAMYAICIYATIKALFRCFGIQLHESSESEGE